MPYDLKEIAAISGMPGLYRLISPTRAGVIIEALDERNTRSIASARNKVSLLQEISIYTQDYDTTVALTDAFELIHQQYGTDLELTNKSDDRDLSAFMAKVIPDYDRDRVYMSDIKKLVNWYRIVSKTLPYQEETDADAEPADDEAISTIGVVPNELEVDPTGNPEVTTDPVVEKEKK